MALKQSKSTNPIIQYKDLMRFMFSKYTDSQKEIAIETQKEWFGEYDCSVETKYVKSLYIKKDKLVKIKIIPIGLNNLCYHNCCLAKQFDSKYHIMTGHQVCACKCGKAMSYEPHYVVYTEDDDGNRTYYDFTRDFNGETWRWFKPDEKGLYCPPQIFLHHTNIIKKNTGCKCGIKWDIDE